MSFSSKFLDSMISVALESPITFKLAAVMLRNTQPVGPILPNTDRMCCRKRVVASMHAEANSLLNHFGKNLVYTDKWRVLQGKAKVAKV